jgi:transmembrane sensor
MIPNNIKRLIAKELRGKLTSQERTLLNGWYDAQFEKTYSSGEHPDLPSKNFKQLKRKLEYSHGGRSKSLWVAMAAACMVLFLVFHFQDNKSIQKTPIVESPSEAFETVYNQRGVRRSVTLADGSRIYLNSHSTLKIHKKFSTNRVVHLQGEAFFEVAKDSLHPFSVLTQDIETIVLGTAFSVRAFQDQPQVIAVKEGKVNVKQIGGDSVEQTLLQNDQLVVTPDVKFGKVNKIDPDREFAWVEGTIVFDRKPLREVLRELDEWYGLESLETEELGENCSISGTYTKMKLTDILESIKYATGITYELNGKHLKVKYGNC